MSIIDSHPALQGIDLQHRMIPLPTGVTLHAVEAGTGPLVVLLHGFPEFWFSWRHQLRPLVELGYRVVAVDQRGYNLSDKPAGVRSYHPQTLAADIAALIDALGERTADVVGHDWGGPVAWLTAMQHASKVRRLITINGPHPWAMAKALVTRAAQLRRSWYIFMFQVPGLPERILRRDDYAAVRAGFSRGTHTRDAFSSEEIDAYVHAMSQPGALTATVNYYRAALRYAPLHLKRLMRPVHAPTLVIWGDRDPHLGFETALPEAHWVPQVTVEHIPDARHWVQVDKPQAVNDILGRWLGPAAHLRAATA